MNAPNGGCEQDPFDLVVSRLADAKPTRRGVRARCPVHEGPDSKPSLDVDRGEDGKVLIRCRSAKCEVADIVRTIGLEMNDLFVQAAAPTPKRSRPASVPKRYPSADAVAEMLQQQLGGKRIDYDYHDAEGRHIGRVMRFDVDGQPKQFRQARCDGGEWVAQAMETPRPLYRLPDVLKALMSEPVFVTEGEKCADAVMRLALLATTSSQGAQSPRMTNWEVLRGRRVFILPDQDEAGRGFAQAVVELLRTAQVGSVAVLQLEGLAEGQDVHDWIAARRQAGHSDEQIAADLYDIAVKTPPELPATPLDDAKQGDPAPFPLSALPKLCREMVERGAHAQGVDPAFYAVPMLSILGGCVGNSRCVEIKRGWSQPAVIWTALVAPSGSGKSPPQKELLRPIQKRDYELHQQLMEKQRAFEAAMLLHDKKSGEPPPEPPPMLAAIIDDATLEALAARLEHNPRGLLLANDELAGFLKSFNKYRGGDDKEKWLRIYDADMLKVDRKGGLGHGAKRVYVRLAAVSVVGTIQPKIAAKHLSGDNRASGLAARLLVAAPPSRPAKWTDATVPDEVCSGWRMVTESLLDLSFDPEKGPSLIPLDESARPIFVEFHDAIGAAAYAADQSGDGDIAAALSKLRGCAARFALLIELARATETGVAELVKSISAESMRAGILIAEWFESQIRRLYAEWSRATPEAEASLDERILSLLKSGPISEGEIRDMLHRNRTSSEVCASLKRLEVMGRARFVGPQQAGPAGGRPRQVWGVA